MNIAIIILLIILLIIGHDESLHYCQQQERERMLVNRSV